MNLPFVDVISHITFAPHVSEIWIIFGFFFLIFMVLHGFIFRISGCFYRMVFGGFLLLCLANPMLIQETREDKKDVIVLLTDDSLSQNIGSRPQQVQTTIKVLKQKIRNLHPPMEIKSFNLSDFNQDAGSSLESNLYRGLKNSLSQVPKDQLSGVIMITDGQAHDLPHTLPRTLPHDQGPIHILLTGSKSEIDRQITIIQSPAYGLVGEKAELIFRVDQKGMPTLNPATVTIQADGQRPINLTAPIGIDVKFHLPLERRGNLMISLSVDQIPNEITNSNNEVALSINAVRDRLKVLLISGVPHPGERTWRNLLKSDPSVDLVHFTILRPPEKQDETPIHELSLIAFPTRELFQTKLHEFDLIVFDRYRRRGVLPSVYLRNIVKYVNDGGALLEVTGPSYASPYSLYHTILGDILPGDPNGVINQRPFKPALTESGLRHPVTARLPKGPIQSLEDDIRWGRWLRQISVQAKEGDTLMQGVDGQPLLILNRVRKGRVAQLYSDQIWLWARGYEGGGPYAELIRRLSHWLMKEPELEENSLEATITGNILSVSMRSLVPVEAITTIQGPENTQFKLPLQHKGNGLYQGQKEIEINGLYHISNGRQKILANQDQTMLKEWKNMVSSAEPIRQLWDHKNASLHYIEEGLPTIKIISKAKNVSGNGWIGLKENHAFTVTGISFVEILQGWFGLAIGLFLLALTWRKEGRS